MILKALNFTRCKNIFSGWKLSVLVLLLYAVFTVILTYPVAFTIGSNIPGSGDAFQWMNYLWYSHGLMFSHQTSTLGYSTLLFWPTGIPLASFSSAYNQILAVFLLAFISLPATYSLLWISTFVIGAFGAYLLVEYLTHNPIAAFIAGVAFAFSPFHFVHAQGHLGATTIQWIPFCALYLMKMVRENNFKHSIIAGLFFILVGMSDLQYLVFMGIFVALIFLFEVWTRSIRAGFGRLNNFKNILKRYMLFGLVTAIGILPFVIGDITVAISATNYLKPDPLEATLYSADILSFLFPHHSIR